MKSKKAQLQISFGMIFSIILIIFFIVFAFFGVKKFLGVNDEITSKKLINDLDYDIDKMWKSSKGSEEVSYSVPRKVDAVCFTDDEYENIYFFPREDFAGGILTHLDIDKTLNKKDRLCIPAEKRKVNFVIDKDYGENLIVISKEGRDLTGSTSGGGSSGGGNTGGNTGGGSSSGGTLITSSTCQGNPGELLIVDEIFIWTESECGFHYWYNWNYPPNGNWRSPLDYYNGIFYARFEIIGQPTNTPSMMQINLWNDDNHNELGMDTTSLNGPGSVGYVQQSPSEFWEGGNGINFYSFYPGVHSEARIGAVLRNADEKIVGCPDWGFEPSIWNQRSKWLSMKIRVTVVGIPKGGSFSGWNCWLS